MVGMFKKKGELYKVCALGARGYIQLDLGRTPNADRPENIVQIPEGTFVTVVEDQVKISGMVRVLSTRGPVWVYHESLNPI